MQFTSQYGCTIYFNTLEPSDYPERQFLPETNTPARYFRSKSMKFLLMLAATGLTFAQSNPSWWKYVPPDSASIVGIQWKELRSSMFAPAITTDLSPGGNFGFPDLELLRKAEQIVVSSPSMLAIEYGSFSIEALRTQAEAKGLKRVAFRPAELYLSPDPAVRSVAYISEKLLLVGDRKTLEEAVTRIASAKERAYSPLLSRAARYSKEDLWVVAARLPDPLASSFLPFEIEATAFEGSVSVWDGLHLVAAVERSSPMKALDFADTLAEDLASRPAMAEATEITTRDRSVLIRMDLTDEQLLSSLRMPSPALEPARDPHALVSKAAPAKPEARAFVPPPVPPATQASASLLTAQTPDALVSVPAPQVAPKAVLPPAPPKTIRIIGLDSGTREIPLGQ